jgi:hypothetical protein
VNLDQLYPIRWAVRGALALGVVASVGANILHADPNPTSQTIAAWPPLALLLTVELISRVPIHSRALAVVRLIATTCIAGIAAWVSYWHMAGVVARYGETGASSYLYPLSVDGLVVVASITLVQLSTMIRDAEQVAREAAEQARRTTGRPTRRRRAELDATREHEQAPAEASRTPADATHRARPGSTRRARKQAERGPRPVDLMRRRYDELIAAGTDPTAADLNAAAGGGQGGNAKRYLERWESERLGRDVVAEAEHLVAAGAGE